MKTAGKPSNTVKPKTVRQLHVAFRRLAKEVSAKLSRDWERAHSLWGEDYEEYKKDFMKRIVK